MKDWTGNKNSIFKTLGASNHTDKERQKEDNRELREYIIKGQKVMAYSKKDAIKRLNHKNSK